MMRRTEMKRTPMNRGTSILARSAWKKRAPKKRAGHDKQALTACKGQHCYLVIPGICIGGTITVVPAHSNEQAHGKGMGIKARDEFTVPACFACHHEIDQGSKFTKQEKFGFWRAAYAAWQPVRDGMVA